MPPASNAASNRTTALEPTQTPNVPWRVSFVEPLADYRIHVRFIDGLEGTVDLSKLVNSDQAGVFAALRDPSIFAGVGLSYGAVIWPGDIDLAPDAMHDEIKAHGEWVLQPYS